MYDGGHSISDDRATMTYEDYLNEVTTLITEIYGMGDAKAIKLVMRAQEASYFSDHDDFPAMRTQERAEQDAKIVFDRRKEW